MEFRVRGVGKVSIQELEARFVAFLNASAPEPKLEGTPEERRAMLKALANRGDSQMKAFVHDYLSRHNL
jgi:hypothetical protein